MEVRMSEYAIPWDQSIQISTWAKKHYPMVWLENRTDPGRGGR